MRKCAFKICRMDASWKKTITEEHTGYEVDIFVLRCFVDHRSPRCWIVTEAMTGYAFADGDTRAEAVQCATSRLKQHTTGGLVGALMKTAHAIGAKGLSWPVNESRDA